MRKGSTRRCARTTCGREFVVERGDHFVTCPGCRLYSPVRSIGPTQPLPHARGRKLKGDDGGTMLRTLDHGEVG